VSRLAAAAATRAGPIPVLISNYPEAQAAAIAAGARPGFGKQSLYAEETKVAIKSAFDAASTQRDRVMQATRPS
jgi:hypothetical protein